MRVASIGGGPGNDAVGFVVYNRQQPRPQALPTRVDVTVFDFCAEWEPIVRSVGAALAATDDAFPHLEPHLEISARDTSWFREAPNIKQADADQADTPSRLLDIGFDFRLADLTAPAFSSVNAALLAAVPRTSIFLFSNVWGSQRYRMGL